MAKAPSMAKSPWAKFTTLVAVDQRKPERHQRVDAANPDPGEEELKIEAHGYSGSNAIEPKLPVIPGPAAGRKPESRGRGTAVRIPGSRPPRNAPRRASLLQAGG